MVSASIAKEEIAAINRGKVNPAPTEGVDPKLLPDNFTTR